MKSTELRIIHTRMRELFSLKEVTDQRRQISYWQKSEGEYVTNLDLIIDEYLQVLLKKVLDVPVVSEEREIPYRLPRTFWLVDPLDGTHNHIADLSPTAISIALMVDGLPVVALVSQLADGYTRSTYKGASNIIDDFPAPSSPKSQPLIGLSTGIIRESINNDLMAEFVKFLTGVGRIRIFGSQAMQGLWVSEGKLKMSFSYESRAWDDAAAGLLVAESGGRWFCFTDRHTSTLKLDHRTSSSFVSQNFKKDSSVALGLYKSAMGKLENYTYSSLGMEPQ